jgi:PAS domain S-box-containing protein
MTRKVSPRIPAAPAPGSARALRVRAEQTIKDHPASPPENLAGVSAHEMHRIIHELRVHQIEVEAQNDELRRQHAELAAAETRNADLKQALRIKSLAFDLAINAISIANPEGVLTTANTSFLRIWGYSSKEEVVGKPILHFFLDRREAAANMEALNEAGRWEGTFAAKRKDGSSFIAHGLAAVLRDEMGQHIGYQSSVLDITERRRMEAALQTSEARYREIFELAADGILQSSPRGIITGANVQMLKLAGRSLDQLLGQHVSSILVPDELVTVPLQLDVSDNKWPLVVERHLLRPDGTRVPVESHPKMMPDGTCQTIYHDITERKRAEAALHASEARYREIFELAADGILQGSPGGIIISANLQMQKLAGRSLDQLLGQHVSVLFGPEELTAVPLRFDLLNKELPLIFERNLLRPDGTCVPVEMHSKMMPDGTYQTICRDLTERKRAEQALSEFHEMFRAFMRNAPIMSYILAVTPTESRIVYASDNYEQWFGKPMAEILGKTTAEFFPPEVCARMHEADLQTVTSGAAMQTEQEVKGRTCHVIKFPIVQASRTLVAGYTIDITERKQAEQTLQHWNQALERQVAERTEALQHSEARFRQLAEITSEGIAIIQNGRLIDGNAQLAKIHGYELAEMIGRPVLDFVAPESRETVAEIMRLASDAIYACFDLRKDGSVVPIEAHGRMGEWDGRSVRLTALRDLTESKRMAARIQAQQTELDRVGRLALISEISAAIIHQICQPISSLSTNLAVAMAAVGGCGLQRCNTPEILNAIQEDVTRMREIVIHLRALAHPERPVRSRIDLNRVVVDVLPLLEREAAIRQIRLEIALAADLPPLLADAIPLKQVVLNLVRNAFDACAECSPLRRRVTITTRSLPGQELELCVWDAGIGIAPAIEDRLFEVFFTTKQEGHGLGLRLCRTIVQAHDGSIEAANNPEGCGAVFRVLLPAEA